MDDEAIGLLPPGVTLSFRSFWRLARCVVCECNRMIVRDIRQFDAIVREVHLHHTGGRRHVLPAALLFTDQHDHFRIRVAVGKTENGTVVRG